MPRGRKPRPLSEETILAWADDHYAQTGRWPTADSGPVLGVDGRRWGTIDKGLRDGVGGLPGGDSLARLLCRHGRRDRSRRPWTPAEDQAILSLPLQEAVRQPGRAPSTV